MQLNTTRLTVSIFLLMLVTLTNAHQCYVCGIDGNLSCDNFNTRNNIFIQDCPPDFKACGIQTDGSSVRRSCENMRLQDCQMANGVEYCYCTTTLCNDSKIKSVPTTDDEDMLEGSGEGTVITIQTKHKDKPTNVSNHLEFYFCNTYILVLALLCNWFKIKTQPYCKDGPKHILTIIKQSRYLADEPRAIVDSVMQRNAYFCHPENILLAMLADNRHVRELGLRRILKARSKANEITGIRQFTIPKLNFYAEDYIDLIDWNGVVVTEPPLTRGLSDDSLQRMISSIPEKIDTVDIRYPCHTQAVERIIKIVTEASRLVCGQEAREGFIHARISSRQSLPQFEMKKEFIEALGD